MAISIVKAGAVAEAASATSLSPALPAGLASGDVMILAAVAGADITTTITGWTLLPGLTATVTTDTVWTIGWYRVATASESAPTVVIGAAARFTAQITAYSGADTSTPFAVNAVTATIASSTAATGSLTVGPTASAASGSKPISVCGLDAATASTPTAPADMTSYGASTGTGRRYMGADKSPLAAAGTVSETWTQSQTGVGMVLWLAVLKAAAGGGGTAFSGTVNLTGTGALSVTGSGPAGQPANSWSPTMSDEFNGSSLDTARWNTILASGQTFIPNNQEQEWYDAAGVTVSGGTCKLTATRLTNGTQNYRSGLIQCSNSANPFGQQYGFFEARMKLPTVLGTWPAFWLVPQQADTWPPEIDILESYGTYGGTSFDATFHYDLGAGAGAQQVNANIATDVGNWHIYGLKWDATTLTVYVDGVQKWTTTTGVATAHMVMTPILNLAVSNASDNTPTAAQYPQVMEIDYVRVWQPVSAGSGAGTAALTGTGTLATASQSSGRGAPALSATGVLAMGGTPNVAVITTKFANAGMIRVSLDFTAAPGTHTTATVTAALADGTSYVVRGASPVVLSAEAGVVDDFEAPLDIGVTYTAVTNVGTTQSSGTVTMGSSEAFGQPTSWLKDPAVPSRNVPVQLSTGIGSSGAGLELSYPARMGVFDVIGKSNAVAVAGVRGAIRSRITLATLNPASIDDLRAILLSGNVLLLQTPGGYRLGNTYIAVNDVTEQYPTRVLRLSARYWLLDAVEVDRPIGAYMATLNTWADTTATYGTWGAMAAQSWLTIMQGADPNATGSNTFVDPVYGGTVL